VYGPGDSVLDHTPGEHVVIEEYETAIRVLVGTLEGLMMDSRLIGTDGTTGRRDDGKA